MAGTRYAFAALCVTGASAPAVVSTDAVGTAMATRWRTTAPTLTAVRTGQTDLPASITAAALSDNGAAIYAEVKP